MDTGQNQTKTVPTSPTPAQNVRPPELLKYLQNEYITFCASSGMSMSEDGEFVTMTVADFAKAAGVARSTLYEWQKRIPNFWQLVDERAREIFNMSTKFAIFKGQKLKAMAGDTKAAEFVLSHYSDYTPPAQKHEVKLSGWGDMVREARNKKIKSNRPAAMEGEVVQPAAPAPPVSPPPQPAPDDQPQPTEPIPAPAPVLSPTVHNPVDNSQQPVIT